MGPMDGLLTVRDPEVITIYFQLRDRCQKKQMVPLFVTIACFDAGEKQWKKNVKRHFFCCSLNCNDRADISLIAFFPHPFYCTPPRGFGTSCCYIREASPSVSEYNCSNFTRKWINGKVPTKKALSETKVKKIQCCQLRTNTQHLGRETEWKHHKLQCPGFRVSSGLFFNG